MNRYTVVVCLCLPIVLSNRLGAAQNDCSRPNVPRWVAHTYDFVTEHDILALYAIQKFGPPTDCSGQVTTVFDGNEFGSLRIEFVGGQVFQIHTYPPESSAAILTDSSGLADPSGAVDALHRYADGIGLEIDWSDPIEKIESPFRTITFWDPDDGLNASTHLVYADSTLVEIGVSMAL